VADIKWLYSVMVSTSDSDSGNPSSIPGTTFSFCIFPHPAFSLCLLVLCHLTYLSALFTLLYPMPICWTVRSYTRHRILCRCFSETATSPLLDINHIEESSRHWWADLVVVHKMRLRYPFGSEKEGPQTMLSRVTTFSPLDCIDVREMRQPASDTGSVVV
jgi:hypothetical protein